MHKCSLVSGLRIGADGASLRGEYEDDTQSQINHRSHEGGREIARSEGRIHRRSRINRCIEAYTKQNAVRAGIEPGQKEGVSQDVQREQWEIPVELSHAMDEEKRKMPRCPDSADNCGRQ